MKKETPTNKYYTYHIKRKGMSLDEGYIGVTQNTTNRFKHHNTANTLTGNAIREFDDIEFRVLICGNKTNCSNLEYKLRPEPNTGWNIQSGGLSGCKASEESRAKMSESRIGKTVYRFHHPEHGTIESNRYNLIKKYGVKRLDVLFREGKPEKSVKGWTFSYIN